MLATQLPRQRTEQINLIPLKIQVTRIGVLDTLYKAELYSYNTYYTKGSNAVDEYVPFNCIVWLHFKRHVSCTNIPEV